jgi:hypothetical protein
MSEPVPLAKIKPRGTILLEEFENSLPNFDSLEEHQQREFSKAIQLITCIYKISESLLEKQTRAQSQLMMNRLKVLYNVYIETNKIIASAIFFVMAHIESIYLDDPDAKLVHDLTSLHMYHPTPLVSASRAPNTPVVGPHWRQPHSVQYVISAASRAASSMQARSELLIRSAGLLLTRFFMQRDRPRGHGHTDSPAPSHAALDRGRDAE